MASSCTLTNRNFHHRDFDENPRLAAKSTKKLLKKNLAGENFYTPVALRSSEPAGCTSSAAGRLRLPAAVSGL